MLTVISPAKRLDEKPGHFAALTQPDFQSDAAYLAGVAETLSVSELQKLMHISENLAQLNTDRFAAFEPEGADGSKPAVLLYSGDTYAGLEAATLDEDALRWAQDHLRILSGLYGLLRPLDAIQPHRLEMGSKLANAQGANLYDFWGTKIADALNRQASTMGTDTLVNCASVEYFSAVDRDRLDLRVITPGFMEMRNGQAKIVSFFAKKARGAMARFIAENRLTDVAALKEFDVGGYRYDTERSSGDSLVFIRDYPEA